MDLERAREILLAHARRPRNLYDPARDAGAIHGECLNPLCGDHVRVRLFNHGDRIERCVIEVHGCTMCTASASLMSEHVKNLDREQARDAADRFAQAVASDSAWPDELADFQAFSHLRVNRARIPCALIPWQALKNALDL
jgi:nitrogen fixation NifU-like protein